MQEKLYLQTMSSQVGQNISGQDVREINVLLARLSNNATFLDGQAVAEVLIRGTIFFMRDRSEERGVSTEHDYRIVAMATLIPLVKLSGFSGSVEDVVTHPSYRGQGLATRMMEAIERHARNLGMAKLSLTSAPHREVARRLYIRLGYKMRDTGVFQKRIL